MQLWATAFVSGAFLLTEKPTRVYLCYALRTHLSQLRIYHPWCRYTHTHAGSLMCTRPQARAAYHALSGTCGPASPRDEKSEQLPRDCRAAWSSNSKTCLAGGNSADSIMVAVMLDIKCKCSWCDKCSRKKGQVQRCLFSAAEIFAYPKGNMLKIPKFSDCC